MNTIRVTKEIDILDDTEEVEDEDVIMLKNLNKKLKWQYLYNITI